MGLSTTVRTCTWTRAGGYLRIPTRSTNNNRCNMAVIFLGDMHGFFKVLDEIVNRGFANEGDTVIQVGDFGVSRGFMNPDYVKSLFDHLPYRLYVIDGNHEDFNVINTWSKTEPTQLAKNVFFIPRGYVMEIEGQLYGFLGGAESVDKAWRTKDGPNRDWFHEERITDADIETLLKNVGDRKLDYLVTHAPPQHTIRDCFPPIDKQLWGLDYGWVDESAIKVQKLLYQVKPKKVVCGHMHKKVIYRDPQVECDVRILAINELAMF